MRRQLANIAGFAKIPLSAIRRQRSNRLLAPLLEHEIIAVRRLGESLRNTVSLANTEEEKRWLSAIEKRRAALLDSDKTIPVIDYGAGSPESRRTQEEMNKGVPSMAKVRDIAMVSKPKFFATMLFNLIRQMKPSSCVELGSCVGISAAYQAAALKINGAGTLVTLEGSPEIAKLAQETFETLNLDNAKEICGPFHETLSPVLAAAKPVDYFFNDGHHDHDAVLKYFDQAMPYLATNAVMVFDDISWSSGMKEAWRKIENDQRVAITLDLGTMGIALIGSSHPKKERYRIPL